MAKIQSFNSEITLELDGILSSDVKAKMTEEFLKYIMYQRQQIPVTFETLKSEIIQEEQKGTQTPRQKRELKKREEIVSNMDKLCKSLLEVFTYGLVKEVLVLLGSTAVTPKELYRLQFPCAFYEGNVLTTKQCTSVLFRKLINNDFLADLKPPKSCTKLTVLALAPREIPVHCDRLVPKLNYKIPQNRGNHMIIKFQSTATVGNADLSKYDETEFDISGIEPLEKFSRLSLTPSVNTHFGNRTNFAKDTSATPCSSRTLQVNTTVERKRQISVSGYNEVDTEDFVWYQIASTVTGYKEKLTKKVDSDSLFMM